MTQTSTSLTAKTISSSINNEPFVVTILTQVAQILLQKGYQQIHHSRLSQQFHSEQVLYQGLSKAVYQCQPVMIKWQLQHSTANGQRQKSPLVQEIHNLKQISVSFAVESRQPCQNIVPILAFIENISIAIASGEYKFDGLVMPYFQQQSVPAYLKNNSINEQQKWQLIDQMLQTVDSLHRHGWIHGDIKPSNFLVKVVSAANNDSLQHSRMQENTLAKIDSSQSQFHVVLTDFANAQQLKITRGNNTLTTDDLMQTVGLVTTEATSEVNSEINSKGTAETILTTTSQATINTYDFISRTPAYTAPECWLGSAFSIESDIYALGVTIFEVIVGRKPFVIENHVPHEGSDLTRMQQWAKLHCQSPVPLLPDNWQMMQPIIDKMLAKKLTSRFKTIQNVSFEINCNKKQL